MRWATMDWSSWLKSLAVHAVLLALLFAGWQFHGDHQAAKPQPVTMRANLVSREILVPKKEPAKPQAVKPKTVKPKPEPKKVQPKPEQTPRQKPKPTPKKPPEPKKIEKPKKKPEPKPVKKQPEKPAQAVSFEDLLAEESRKLDIKPRADKKPQKTDSKPAAAPVKTSAANSQENAQRIASELDTYKGLIQQTMRRYWQRPPSMVGQALLVKLQIRLLPGGEVNDVKVLESSGNSAFDRSAVTAVLKAARFSVPTDITLFNQHFRTFIMIFNPNG